ncbi:hypothetical protein PCA31118_04287 [Pandoraea captiosa]|uniref:Uncharacterized protein n=1 Tax=Pandoraea captiosa TaxID=2508302 RepID=A0A5E5AJK4_9BURK|nr:hypothetical protein [Pandoraea captiosa]VVE72713.1 hypothetical protein PCA31118_04287 [Pandoraea captiosa]
MTTKAENTTQRTESVQPAELSAEEIAQVGGGVGPNRYNTGLSVPSTTSAGATKPLSGGRGVAG